MRAARVALGAAGSVDPCDLHVTPLVPQDLSRLSIAELKRRITAAGKSFAGCVEKQAAKRAEREAAERAEREAAEREAAQWRSSVEGAQWSGLGSSGRGGK